MNPITDTNLLRHHRVNYGAKIDYEGRKNRSFRIPSIVWLAAFVPVVLTLASFSA